jgi:dTDP-4-amino-4,6-dideoxygalactose transaminase
MRSLRSHGILQNVKRNNFNKFYYEQRYLGFNYRMSDINASLGLSQIDRLNDILKKREFIANFYRKKLNMLEIFLTKKNKYMKSSNHLFIIRLLNKKLIKNHKNIINDLLKKKILVNIHYYPVYLQPFYKKMGFRSQHCPNSETYYHSSFSIPIYEQLKKRELNFVVKNLKEIVNKYLK